MPNAINQIVQQLHPVVLLSARDTDSNFRNVSVFQSVGDCNLVDPNSQSQIFYEVVRCQITNIFSSYVSLRIIYFSSLQSSSKKPKKTSLYKKTGRKKTADVNFLLCFM